MIAVSPKANKSVATVVAVAVVVAVVAVVAAVVVTTSRSKVPNTIKSIEFLGARGPWPPTQTGAIKFIFSYTRDRARARAPVRANTVLLAFRRLNKCQGDRERERNTRACAYVVLFQAV